MSTRNLEAQPERQPGTRAQRVHRPLDRPPEDQGGEQVERHEDARDEPRPAEPFAEGDSRLHLALAKGEARLLRAELFVEYDGKDNTRLVLRLDPGLARAAELFELPAQAA